MSPSQNNGGTPSADATWAVLAEASKRFAAARSFDDLLGVVARLLTEHIGDQCVVRLLDETKRYLDPVAIAHRDPAREPALRAVSTAGRLRFDEGFTGRAFAADGPTVVRLTSPQEAAPHTTAGYAAYAVSERIVTLLSVPLSGRTGKLGVLGLARSVGSPPYGPADVALARELGERAALAVENAMLFEAAKQREEALRVVTDTLPVLISYVDRDFRYQLNNAAYLKWFGGTKADYKNKPMREVVGETVFERIRPRLERALAGEAVHYEDLLPYKSAGHRYVSGAYVPDVGPDGRVRGVVVLVQDISEEHARQERAQASHRLSSSLAKAGSRGEIAQALVDNAHVMLDTSSSLVCIVDPLDASKLRIVASKGLPEAFLTRFASFPADAPFPLCDAIRRRAPIRLNTLAEFTAAYPDTPGSRDPMNSSGVALPLVGADGEVHGGLALTFAREHAIGDEEFAFLTSLSQQCAQAIDRVDLLERESFLADASARLAQAVDAEHAFRAIVTLAVPKMADWCIIDILQPDGTLRRYAHSPDAALAAAVDEIARHPPRPGSGNRIWDVIRTGRTTAVEDVPSDLIDNDGNGPEHAAAVRRLGLRSFLCVPLVAQGKVLGCLSLVMGRSQRRYSKTDRALAEEIGRRAAIAVSNANVYDELHQAVKTRDEFLSIASHELKTPLTSVSLILQYLQRVAAERESGAAVASKLAAAHAQTQRLAQLIDDLMDLGKIQAGKIGLVPVRASLAGLLARCVASVQSVLDRAGCPVTIEAPADLDVTWDAARMEQVLTNLLTNAAKYAPGKAVRVEAVSEGGRVTIRIRDRGPGIAPEKLASIFERFERAGASRTVGGLGLGLYIVKQIVLAHGGAVHAESSPGAGTTFVLDLPRDFRPPETAP